MEGAGTENPMCERQVVAAVMTTARERGGRKWSEGNTVVVAVVRMTSRDGTEHSVAECRVWQKRIDRDKAGKM